MLVKGISFLIGVSTLLLIASVETAVWLASICLTLYVIIQLVSKVVSKSHRSLFDLLIKPGLLGICWAGLNVVIWTGYTGQLILKPGNAIIEGTICSIPITLNKQHQFEFCVEKMNGTRVSFAQLNRVKLSWGKFIEPPKVTLGAGQYWQFNAKLKPSHGRYNPAGFDYSKWMLAEGLAGSGYIKSAQILSVSSFTGVYHQLRQQVYQRLNDQIPENHVKGLLLALAMGERGAISQQQWDALQGSGTSHLLAISGLHVGVAALWFYWILFFIWRLSHRLCLLIPAQLIAQLGSLFGGGSVLLLSGCGLPAQRAFIMLVIFLLSRWYGRHFQLSSVLGIAILAITILHPFAVLSASFWLSFIAVLVIVLSLSRQHKQPNSFATWIKINGYLYLTMLPISIIFFDMFSWISIIANLILVPLVSFILIPLLYLAMALMFISSSLAEWPFWSVSKIMQGVYWLQLKLASFNDVSQDLSLSLLSLFLLLLVVFLVLVPRQVISKVVFLPLILAFGFGFSSSKTDNLFEMIVFDIGQGLAIYIQTPDGNLLFDTGWGNEEYAIASSTIVPFLHRNNIRSIDKLVLSHNDSDHAGGENVIEQAVSVLQTISGESNHREKEVSCHNFPNWQWQGIDFQFLTHLPNERLIGNNASCVLSISSLHFSLLLTGDIEKSAEMALIKKEVKEHEILVAPHHGSKTSSTQRFVEQINPKHVIFSSGYANQWGFPRSEVVKRYQDINSTVWITHQHGAISVTIDPENQLKVTSFRQEKPHFWL